MNVLAVRPELRAMRRSAPLWANVRRAWRAPPYRGPLFHASADGRWHLDSAELGLRLQYTVN